MSFLGNLPVSYAMASKTADFDVRSQSRSRFVAEHFLPIEYKLMGLKGAKLSDLKRVKSHVQAADDAKTIAYQGEPGANSDIACREVYSDYAPMACPTFEDAFACVKRGDAALAISELAPRLIWK